MSIHLARKEFGHAPRVPSRLARALLGTKEAHRDQLGFAACGQDVRGQQSRRAVRC